MDQKQIIMLGNTSVGKTNIVLRYTKDEFISEHISTIGIDFQTKDLVYKKKQIKMHIFDTNGNDKYTSFLPKNYYRNANGIMLVFSIDDTKSFKDLNFWLESIKENSSTENIVIVANKTDLEASKWVIKESQIQELELSFNKRIERVSAKSGVGIDEAFLRMVAGFFGDDSVVIDEEVQKINLEKKSFSQKDKASVKLTNFDKDQSSSTKCC